MRRTTRPGWWRAAVLAGAVLLVLALVVLVSTDVLMAAPAVLLAATLASGWFPGATVLDRLRRLARRPRRRAPRVTGARRGRPQTAVRSGALLGLHLAGHGPPAAATPAD